MGGCEGSGRRGRNGNWDRDVKSEKIVLKNKFNNKREN